MKKTTREWVRKAEADYLTELLPHYPNLGSLRRGLLTLNDFAVDARYPGESLTKRNARSALRWAGRVREACRTLLGIRPRRKPAP